MLDSLSVALALAYADVAIVGVLYWLCRDKNAGKPKKNLDKCG